MSKQKLLRDEPLSKKLLKTGSWTYIFGFIIAPCAYLVRMIISNDLSVEQVGLVYAVWGLISLLTIYNDLGVTSSLKYFLPKFRIEKKQNYIRSSIIYSLFIELATALILGTLLFIYKDWLAINYFHSPQAATLLVMFTVYFVGLSIYEILFAIFYAFQDTFHAKLMEFIKVAAMLIYTGCLLFFNFGYLYRYGLARTLGLLIAIIFGVGVFISKYHFLLKGQLVRDRSMLKKYFSYAFWLFLGMNAGILMGNIDMQMIIYFLGQEAAGYYTNYLSLVGIVGFISTPIIGILLPILTELITKKDDQKIILLQTYLYKYFLILSVFMGGMLLVLGPVISTVLYGVKFMYAGILIQYSALFLIPQILLSINFQILGAYGFVKIRSKIVWVAAIMNILLNLLLIPWIGLFGAIISTVLGWILMFTWSYVLSNRIKPISIPWQDIRKNILLIVSIVLLVYILRDNMFVYDNIARYSNLLYLFIVYLFGFTLLALVNKHDVLMIYYEVKKLITKGKIQKG